MPIAVGLAACSCTVKVQSTIQVNSPERSTPSLETPVLSSPPAGTLLPASAISSSYAVSGLCANAGAQVLLEIDGTPAPGLQSSPCNGASWTATFDLTAIPDGTHLLSVMLRSSFGTSSSSVPISFTKDTTAPTLAISSPSAGFIVNAASDSNAFAISGSCDEPSRKIDLIIDGAPVGSQAGGICDGAAWSATFDATALSEGAHTLRATLTDAAGNSASTSALAFQRDVTGPTAPSLSIAGGGAYTTASSVALSLSASGASQMYVTNTSGCGSGGSWIAYSASVASWNLGQSNSSAQVFAKFRDDAANETACVSDSIIHDSTPPAIALGSITALAGGGSVSIGWTLTEANTSAAQSFSIEYFDGASWSALGDGVQAAANGPLASRSFSKTWTVPALNTANARIRLGFTDLAGQSTTVTSPDFIIDSARPSLTLGQMSINEGAADTYTYSVRISLAASDALSKITRFCLKYNDSTAPAAGAPCWIPVNAPSPGLVPAQTLTLGNFNFSLGTSPMTYTVYAWVEDQAGNTSELTNSGGGTSTQDKASIFFLPDPPPAITSIVAASMDLPSSPALPSELSAPAGTSVYIRWTASDTTALPANPISLYYSTNSTSWTPIPGAINLLQGANGACSVDDPATPAIETGCFEWANGSPVNTYYVVRVGITDSAGKTTFLSSAPLNASQINFLAGNTDPGTGGSASAAVFSNHISSNESHDGGSLVVTSTGKIYFRDIKRGILMIDPADGIQQLFLPTTGVSSGDGGNASLATLRFPARIALDFNENLLILDHDRIRRVNLGATPPTIDTIIGGGDSVADNVLPLDVKIENPSTTYGYHTSLIVLTALPDGKIYFESKISWSEKPVNGKRLRVYDPSTGLVTSLNLSGIGNDTHAAFDIANCNLQAISLAFDPATSDLTALTAVTETSTAPACGAQAGVASTTKANFNPVTGVSEAPHGTNPPGMTWLLQRGNATGMDGNLYGAAKATTRLYRYDAALRSWSTIAGTGVRGYCPDGTPALSCNMNPNEIFVNASGKVYFMDSGMVRTIDPSGNVLTLAGQPRFMGNGASALAARFGRIFYIDQWASGEIVLFDEDEYRFRAVAIGGNIEALAGNGGTSDANTASPATSQPLRIGPWDTRSAFVLDPATGDVIFGARGNFLSRLVRATGLWTDIAGGGATSWLSADTQTGNNISFPNYFIRAIGWHDSKVLAIPFQHHGTNGNRVTYKLYDLADSARQSHLLGTGNIHTQTTFCADGTAPASCEVPLYSTDMRATYDPVASHWLFAQTGTAAIRAVAPGGPAVSTLVTLPQNIQSFAYRRTPDSLTHLIYYCSSTGRLYRYDMNTSTETAYVWPIPGLRCTGRVLLHNSTRNSLIFPYVQNDLYGIAEYLNP